MAREHIYGKRRYYSSDGDHSKWPLVSVGAATRLIGYESLMIALTEHPYAFYNAIQEVKFSLRIAASPGRECVVR